MKTTTGLLAAVVLVLVPAASLLAHHSLANFDTTKAVRVKGTVVEFHQMNPHSFIFLDEKLADGQSRRWAIEGPTALQLTRKGFAKDALKPGDVVEVCGYVPAEAAIRQTVRGRLINAETLVLPDGRQESWGDYGAHKCFPPGYADQHSRAN
jgi:hypothetical protein